MGSNSDTHRGGLGGRVQGDLGEAQVQQLGSVMPGRVLPAYKRRLRLDTVLHQPRSEQTLAGSASGRLPALFVARRRVAVLLAARAPRLRHRPTDAPPSHTASQCEPSRGRWCEWGGEVEEVESTLTAENATSAMDRGTTYAMSHRGPTGKLPTEPSRCTGHMRKYAAGPGPSP